MIGYKKMRGLLIPSLLTKTPVFSCIRAAQSFRPVIFSPAGAFHDEQREQELKCIGVSAASAECEILADFQ